MKEKKEYNLEEESYDMELSKAYDEAIKLSALKRNPKLKDFFEDNGVYLNLDYLNSHLLKQLEKDELLKTYKNEYSRFYSDDKKTRCKMCSIASSSRYCYLKYRKSGFKFEAIRNNGQCKPHLDAYDDSTNTYFECKCHEIVKPHEITLSKDAYEEHLINIFGVSKEHIKCSDDSTKIELNYEMFGIKDAKLPIGKYFDFKQLVCHIIGLLGEEVKPNPTLQYVFFIPDEDVMQENVLDWKNKFKDHVKDLFENIKQNIKLNGRPLEEAITLKYSFVEVSLIDDLIK